MSELKEAGIGCPYCGKSLYVDFDICPHCGNEVPAALLQIIQSQSGNQSEQVTVPTHEGLTHFEDLEEESKTKIGTFEHLYEEYAHKPHAYGFDDVDYAPLGNLLGAIMEIELSLSIFDKFMPVWQDLSKKYDFEMPTRSKCTLGSITTMLRLIQNRNDYKVAAELSDDWQFAQNKFGPNFRDLYRPLDKILQMRNKSSHKNILDEQAFTAYYQEYHEFYEKYMPALLQLKLRGRSAGYRLFASFRQQFPVFDCVNGQR